jgi:hypothetical protein
MKILILFLISFNCYAYNITPSEEVELNHRLELYGLLEVKPLIPQETEKTYDNSTILKLQKFINEKYIPDLENHLGRCGNDNCLTQHSDYKEFKLQNKTICLPYTQCGFYKCMEKKYQCKPEGVTYFTDLAYPTCSTYMKNINKKWFSQKGHDWIYSVMVCLQKGLIDECEVEGNCKQETRKKTCEYVTDFTLKFHPGCYTNSGVGVCKLPMKDKINIWRTVGKYLTKREQQEAFKVVLSCIRKEKGSNK